MRLQKKAGTVRPGEGVKRGKGREGDGGTDKRNKHMSLGKMRETKKIEEGEG